MRIAWAGGVPSDDFTLGDVIISNRIVNFNVSKHNEDGTVTFNIRGGSGIHPDIKDIVATLSLSQENLTDWSTSASITLSHPTVDLSQFDTDTFKKKIAANTNKNMLPSIKIYNHPLHAILVAHAHQSFNQVQ